LIFISLLRLFTFCPSVLSSILGVRFRRGLSVVEENFFNELVLEVLGEFWFVVETVVDVPNNRNGEIVIGWKSSSSDSVGLGFFGFNPPPLFNGDARLLLLLLSIESLRCGNNLNVG